MRAVLCVSLCIPLGTSLCVTACSWMRPSDGGGQTVFSGSRAIEPDDVALPAGYRIESVASGLTFPTGVVFDDDNTPYVIESGYSYGEAFTTPRLLRIVDGGRVEIVAEGGWNGPWTGVVYDGSDFIIAEGGVMEGGKILRVTKQGDITPLIEGLPSFGDHHTNGPAIGRDGAIYFSVGTATNSGVVGADNIDFGWAQRRPDFHDIPCKDIVLNGQNFTATGPNGERWTTGAFKPLGTSSTAGEIIEGRVPCTGAVMRIRPDGTGLELVAWGFRNPFGLAFHPDGDLYVTENGYDERGSRPLWGTPDVLWRVEEGRWYGWPDYSEGRSLTLQEYAVPGTAPVQSLLARAPESPPSPVAIFEVHSSADGFDFSRNPAFGYVGDAFVAMLGDEAPVVGKVLSPVGFKIARVDMARGVVDDFAINRNPDTGPASKLGGGGLERPVAARFDRAGAALYVVDFGVLIHDPKAKPVTDTGVLWRITRE